MIPNAFAIKYREYKIYNQYILNKLLISAIIYAFNVDVHSNARELLKQKNIDIRMHNVLYKMIDDLKSELSSRIKHKDVEKIIGNTFL